jgi:hypothetical protein
MDENGSSDFDIVTIEMDRRIKARSHVVVGSIVFVDQVHVPSSFFLLLVVINSSMLTNINSKGSTRIM